MSDKVSELKPKPKKADIVDLLRLRNAQLEVEKAELLLAAAKREQRAQLMAFTAKYEIGESAEVNYETGEIARKASK